MLDNVDAIHRISEMQGPVFLLSMVSITVSETWFPLRSARQSRRAHMTSNLLLSLLNFAILGTFSFTLIEYTFHAFQNGWGLFNILGWQGWPAILLQVLLYDLLNYSLHRTLHSFDALWLAHRTHHSDTNMNASSTFRFHPLEGLFRLIFQGLFLVLLGVHPYAIVAYNIFAIPVFIISHSNVRLPLALEHVLGALLVMPRDHTVHHRPDREEHDNNYGTIFIIWDRLLGTYRSFDTLKDTQVGIHSYPLDRPMTVRQMLMDPWCERGVPHVPSVGVEASQVLPVKI